MLGLHCNGIVLRVMLLDQVFLVLASPALYDTVGDDKTIVLWCWRRFGLLGVPRRMDSSFAIQTIKELKTQDVGKNKLKSVFMLIKVE